MATNTQDQLAKEIAAYEAQLSDLEKNHPGKFVVFKDEKLVGAWDTLNAAASAAVAQFGRGPYLIRQVGAPPPTLPASVFFRPQALA
jgi:hypothetical protein